MFARATKPLAAAVASGLAVVRERVSYYSNCSNVDINNDIV